MTIIQVEVGDELFSFNDFDHWCDNAQKFFLQHHVRSADVLCVDALGRVCSSGREFMRAHDEGVYPIRVYAIGSEADRLI